MANHIYGSLDRVFEHNFLGAVVVYICNGKAIIKDLGVIGYREAGADLGISEHG